MNLPYKEGTVFLVPLRTGGYGRGVVARCSPKGKIVFGYFFGPRVIGMEERHFDDLSPEQTVLRLRFGDLGLIDGKWPIVGLIPNWKRPHWPMPDFIRVEDRIGDERKYLVRYSDSDPSIRLFETPQIENSDLQPDVLSGCGLVEIKLTKLLGG